MRPTRRFFVIAAVVLAGMLLAEAFALVSVRNENQDETDLAQSSPSPEVGAEPSPTLLEEEEEEEPQDEDEEEEEQQEETEEDDDRVAQESGSGNGLLPPTGRQLLNLTALSALLMTAGALLAIAPPVEIYSFDLDR